MQTISKSDIIKKFMPVTTEQQYKIIEAYFQVLQESPDQKITMMMVAKKARISRESVYRYHFRSLEDIMERIYYLIDGEIKAEAEKFASGENHDIHQFLVGILPGLYEKRDWVKILYSTNVAAGWQIFLLKRYIPVIEKYLKEIGNDSALSDSFVASLLVKEFLAVISTWLMAEQPEPPFLFEEQFLAAFQRSPYGFLTNSGTK